MLKEFLQILIKIITKTLKQLRGFLHWVPKEVLPRYDIMAKPLTDMTKRGNFKWTPATEKACVLFKEQMMKAPMLALPDFNIPFELETNAC